MLISRSAQYAIQALIYISLSKLKGPIVSREIAECLNVPVPYLSKIMQLLRQGGLVGACRGRQGGFFLNERPEKINLLRIMHVIEGARLTKDCLLGLKECSDDTACPLHHDKWKPLKSKIVAMLEEQNLFCLAETVRSGQYRLSDIPNMLIPT